MIISVIMPADTRLSSLATSLSWARGS